ncbi:MAG TPA: glycosyltransferase family 4 protein [Conexibacter sp.]|nr:glycosyltransferase family 4 protein [Conexibacter sp.]
MSALDAPAPALDAAGGAATGLRVAYVVGRYPAASHTFIQREVAALRARGAEVATFSIHAPGADDLLAPEDRAERAATTVVLGPPLATATALALALARAVVGNRRGLVRALRRGIALRGPGLRALVWQLFYVAEALVVWAACERRAIRHLHAHHLNQAADVALLACALGGPGWSWSLTLHGPDELYDVGRFKLAAKVRSAALVACISDFCRSQAMCHVEPEHWGKLAIVHCGVDPRVWRAPDRAGRGGPLRVLTVGRLVPAKGHALLLDALAGLRHEGLAVEAAFVGDGPERERLARRAAELGLGEAVRFAGSVGQDRIRAWFERADVFCLPSFAEGVPVVLMEAMAMELPVLTTQVMGIPELVEHERTGLLVPPGRADAVAAALRRLAADPRERARLGAAGRATVVEEFDCHHEGGRLAELLAALVAGSR